MAHACDHGALRSCVHIMDYAVFLAKMQNVNTVDADLLKRAAQSTLERASIVLRDIDEVDAESRATKIA